MHAEILLAASAKFDILRQGLDEELVLLKKQEIIINEITPH